MFLIFIKHSAYLRVVKSNVRFLTHQAPKILKVKPNERWLLDYLSKIMKRDDNSTDFESGTEF